MRQLREALGVMLRYGDGEVSVGRGLILAGPDGLSPDDMSPPDLAELGRMGWHWDRPEECFRCAT